MGFSVCFRFLNLRGRGAGACVTVPRLVLPRFGSIEGGGGDFTLCVGMLCIVSVGRGMPLAFLCLFDGNGCVAGLMKGSGFGGLQPRFAVCGGLVCLCLCVVSQGVLGCPSICALVC